MMRIFLRKFVSKPVEESKTWNTVVGLEVHAQIQSNTKLFSGSQVIFNAPVNSRVSLFDAAIPGTLPVLNEKCVEAGIKTASALNCEINSLSMFDRKHYFYSDLPSGYQITQQRAALANNGVIKFPVFTPGVNKKPYTKEVKLQQLQLEQDSGKSLHDDIRSLVDLNRAGVPLMELVFDHTLTNGDEASSLVKELILILKSLETCSGKMEEGALRVDANVSINRPGEPLGIRTEIKNIGSIRGITQAVNYEIKRQIQIKSEGGVVTNETRNWDATLKKTIAMRDKEIQQDYRFMPEPNLPMLLVDTNPDDKIRGNFKLKRIIANPPQLPGETREELIRTFGLQEETAIILVNESLLLAYFRKIVERNPKLLPKTVTNLLINDFLKITNERNESLENSPISSQHILDILTYIDEGKINLNIGQIVLKKLFDNPDKSCFDIIDEDELWQIDDDQEIERMCKEAIEQNHKAVIEYKKGKKKVLFAIAGSVFNTSNHKVNMKKVVKKLEELLKD